MLETKVSLSAAKKADKIQSLTKIIDIAQLHKELMCEQPARGDAARPQLAPFAEALACRTEALLDELETSACLAGTGLLESILEGMRALYIRLGYLETRTESQPVIATVSTASSTAKDAESIQRLEGGGMGG